MKIEAKIVLEYKNERRAKSIAEAVSPDNIECSELSIKTYSEGCLVITAIRCRKIGTFITTVDDLLRCVVVAEKTTDLVGKRE